MDKNSLHNFAFVSRRVPRSLRNRRISWEHHRKVAKLKDAASKMEAPAASGDPKKQQLQKLILKKVQERIAELGKK